MNLSASPLIYLLDTNILVHLVREDAVSQRILRRYDLLNHQPRPLVCEVTQGELRSLALQFGWGRRRVERALNLLAYFTTTPIGDLMVYETYSKIDQYCVSRGRVLGDNDAWIAAGTVAADALLLTTDHDFDPLHKVFLQREWIDPHLDVGK
jgi:predicted nucleic acid-binding protein